MNTPSTEFLEEHLRVYPAAQGREAAADEPPVGANLFGKKAAEDVYPLAIIEERLP